MGLRGSCQVQEKSVIPSRILLGPLSDWQKYLFFCPFKFRHFTYYNIGILSIGHFGSISILFLSMKFFVEFCPTFIVILSFGDSLSSFQS